MKRIPQMVEYQCGSRDMPQSTPAKVMTRAWARIPQPDMRRIFSAYSRSPVSSYFHEKAVRVRAMSAQNAK
jgi:hypothetical protein